MATNRNLFRRIFVVEWDGGRTSTIGKKTVDEITVEETEGGKFVVVIKVVPKKNTIFPMYQARLSSLRQTRHHCRS